MAYQLLQTIVAVRLVAIRIFVRPIQELFVASIIARRQMIAEESIRLKSISLECLGLSLVRVLGQAVAMRLIANAICLMQLSFMNMRQIALF